MQNGILRHKTFRKS